MSAQAKVGAFFLGFIFLLGYLTMMVGDIDVPFFSNGSVFRSEFERVDGLERGDTVLVSGVPSGEIDDLILAGARVEVRITVDPRVRLPEDSKAMITMDNLLGGKVLSILPGNSEVYIPEGGLIETIESQGIEKAIDALARIGNVAERLEQFLNDLDGTRLEVERSVSGMNDSLASMAEKAEGLIGPLTEVAEGLRDGEGTVGKLLVDDTAFQNIDATLKNLADITKEIREGEGSLGQLIYSTEVVDNLNESLGPLHEVMAKVNRGEGTLGKVVNDPELYHNLNSAFRSFGEAVGDIKVTMANMRQITDDINKGKGTVGGLFKDDTVLKNLNETMADVGEAAETLTDTQSFSVFLSMLGLAF